MKLDVPFYPQSTSFTCDPACLMMALKALVPSTKMSHSLEMDIWRESYGIGIPGCMPQGLAYSAIARGLDATIVGRRRYLYDIPEKIAPGENRRIAIASSKDLLRKAKGAKIADRKPSVPEIRKAVSKGEIPLAMINMMDLHGIDSPHWIVVTGIEGKIARINDPYSKKGRDIEISCSSLAHMILSLKELSGLDERMLLLSKSEFKR